MEISSFSFAIGLTLIAGLATGIGSVIALLAKRINKKFLTYSMGLSAGVMIYVSFMELMPESVNMFAESTKEFMAKVYMLISFFAGIIVIAAIDRLVPEDENPHEIHDKPQNTKLKRTGIMMALAIGIHNFPEGMAVFATAMTHIDIAIPVMIAIAIHNIPEGIAVSAPIYHATGDRKKAFIYSFLSGLSEPIGALLGVFILDSFWTPEINAFLLAFVSGIMIYISFDELLPSTETYGHHHIGLLGITSGLFIMAASLLFL